MFLGGNMQKLIISLVALTFSFMVSSQSPSGNFLVSARNPFGVAYSNPYENDILVSFIAQGEWGFESGSTVDANGDPNDYCYNYGNCPVGWAGVGSLVINQDGYYFPIGAINQVTIGAGKTVYFLMNDAGAAYNDNHGVQNVLWYCLEGCPVN